MKKPLDIDTPKTKRCKSWKELKELGTVVDGITYLPIGIRTGMLPIEETRSYQSEQINEGLKQYESVNIEKFKNHEDKSSNLSYNPDNISD